MKLKYFVTQLEAERNAEIKEEIRAQRVRPSQGLRTNQGQNQGPRPSTSSADTRCFRCNRNGHYQENCPLIGTGNWYCYICRRESDHKSKECPNYEEETPNRYGNKVIKGRGTFRGSRGIVRGFRGAKGPFRGAKSNKRFATEKDENQHVYSKINTRGKGKVTKRAIETSKNRQTRKVLAAKYINDNEEEEEEGKLINNKTKSITFIADSGATEHIVNKVLY